MHHVYVIKSIKDKKIYTGCTKDLRKRFRAELKQPDKSHLLDVMAALSHTTNFSIGCYCDEEKYCHRRILRAELKKRGALIK
jgi:uncharacterized protein YeaO (DUF488 family)